MKHRLRLSPRGAGLRHIQPTPTRRETHDRIIRHPRPGVRMESGEMPRTIYSFSASAYA